MELLFDYKPERWVCLKDANGKLLARFDTQSGILEIGQRGVYYVFDLVELQHKTWAKQDVKLAITASFTSENKV